MLFPKMGLPAVDILMATYNGERFVREQIESIQFQTFSDWRLLVSDDCSTDNTLDIVRDMAAADSRIGILRRLKRSGSAQVNFLTALRDTSADYVMFCDQDDYWLPGKLEAFLSFARDDEASVPSLYFSDMKVVDESLFEVSSSFMAFSKLDPTRIDLNNLLALNCVAGCASMINRPLVNLVNDTKSLEGVVMHDVWVALIAAALGRIVYINEPTVMYRQHFDNSIGAKGYVSAICRGAGKGRERKSALRKTIFQAQAFEREYGKIIPENLKEILDAYASFDKIGKLKRLYLCYRHGFWKYGVARLFDQIMNL